MRTPTIPAPEDFRSLDRNYLGGWLVLLALVVIGVALAAIRRRSSPDAAGSPSVPGRS